MEGADDVPEEDSDLEEEGEEGEEETGQGQEIVTAFINVRWLLLYIYNLYKMGYEQNKLNEYSWFAFISETENLESSKPFHEKADWWWRNIYYSN